MSKFKNAKQGPIEVWPNSLLEEGLGSSTERLRWSWRWWSLADTIQIRQIKQLSQPPPFQADYLSRSIATPLVLFVAHQQKDLFSAPFKQDVIIQFNLKLVASLFLYDELTMESSITYYKI